MKKRVRLYKAQEGGMPDANMLGYPGAQAQQSNEGSNDQVVSMILTDIGNSLSKDQIIAKLVTVYNQDADEANQIVDQVYKYVEQQKQSEVDAADSEDDEEEDVMESVAVEEEIQAEPESTRQTGTQMSNEIIDEWDDSSDDDSQLASDIIMQYGGYPMAQDGMEVPIQMPDVSVYLPQDMGDYLGGATNPYSGLAWDRPEMTEDVSEDEQVFSDYTEPELPEERFGGMPSKRSYVNSVLKLVKKQMGGDSAAPESAKYNDDNADPTGANVRKKSLDKFIGSVKSQSNMALAKQQAEQQYEQMMQQQQMMQQYPMAQQGGQQPGQGEQNIYQGQDYENPMHHLALFSQAAGDVFQDDQNELVEAQFGGLFGRRRMNNMMQQGMPMIPGMPPITKIDVRKSGWLFNRPKEYSIEFGQFSPMPGMSMPGLPAGAYGYTSRIIKTPATRRKVEAIAEVVNKEALKEVSTATPTSEATTKVADSPITTTTTISTSTGDKNIPVKVNPKVVDRIKTANNVDSKNTRDGLYSYGNGDGMYKKQNGTWYINRGVKTGMQYVPINDKNRINELNKKADYKGAASKGIKGKSTWQPPGAFNSTAINTIGNDAPNSNRIINNLDGTPFDANQFIFNPNLSPFQEGGVVNDPFADEYGNLQQFIGGGDEDFTQGDLDDVYSKDIDNGDFPMAQWGGGIEALFPANILPRRYGRGYSQMRGVPYDPRTKAAMPNFMPGPGGRINKIDVTKSNWLTGAPKKYTVTYGQTMIGPSNKPGLPNSGTNTSQSQMRESKRTDIPNDLSLAAKMAINKGDRQTARNDRRLARNPQYANYANVPQVDDFTPEELYNKRIMSSLEPRLMPDGSVPAYNPTAKAAGPTLQYGGDLERFLPQAEVGQQSPVTYANNPAVANVTQNYFDKNNQAKPGDFTDIFADYAAANKKDASGGYEQETAVDYKAKKAPGSFDGEAWVNTINAGVQGVTGLINRADNQAAEAKMQDNLTADNLYASDPSKDRGDYDTNSGLYRQDEMGQKWNSRSKQYGGNIYQEGGMVEGDEVDMTEEELADFIANGGEVEYL